MREDHERLDVGSPVVNTLGDLANLYTIEAKLEGERFTCLVDTGASVSIVQQEALGWKLRKRKMRESERVIRTADDTPLDVIGEIELKTSLPSQSPTTPASPTTLRP